LELYGWEGLGERLRAMIREDRWDDLDAVVTDEVLGAVSPTALYDDLPDLLARRFSPLGDGLLLAPPDDESSDGAFSSVLQAVRAR
jgi:hypothetical protein